MHDSVLDHETKLRRHSRDGLGGLDKMGSKQYDDDEITSEMTEGIRTSVSNKKNKTLVEKRESEPHHNLKRTRTETLTLNIHETRETTIYKELSRRPTL